MVTESKAWTRRWAALRRELALRAVEPIEHPTFVIFFIGIVAGVGGIGAWVELVKLYLPLTAPGRLDGLITSLITFFFALVGTSCTQLIIEEAESKALRALAQIVLLFAFLVAALALVGLVAGRSGVVLWLLASAAALFVWWIANAKSPGLRDPDVPTGGTVTKKLPGDLAAYKTE